MTKDLCNPQIGNWNVTGHWDLGFDLAFDIGHWDLVLAKSWII